MEPETLPFWQQFVLSEGFGGAAAVVAALIAGFFVWKSVQAQRASTSVQREAHRREQWWLRTQWALDHIIEGTSTDQRQVGIAAARVMAKSDFATNDEKDLIDAALTALLSAYAGK